MVVPYIQGLGEKFKRTCNKQGIQVCFRGTNSKSLSMAPKYKDNKLQKSGVIYKHKCPHINCPEEYTGESGRTFADRFKEHLKAPSPIYQCTSTTGHPVSPDCFSIVHRESQGLNKNIKETVLIRVNDPSLNRNLGIFQLPHVWDQILQNTPLHSNSPPSSPLHWTPCSPTQSHPLYSLLTLIPTTPLPPIQKVLSLVSTHIYLISITFSPGCDEAATVWWLGKLVCDLNALITLFQQSRRTFNRETTCSVLGTAIAQQFNIFSGFL